MAVDQTNSQSADVVGIFDSNLKQLFATARPLKASVFEDKKMMEHPIESGASITDHQVIQPVEIELSMIIPGEDYPDVYKAIKDAFKGKTTVIVQTRTDTYSNMLIKSMPHEESAEMMDAIPMALKLKQVLLVDVQFQTLPPRKVSRQKDTSVLDRGEQTPKGSVAYNLFNGSK